MDESIKSYIDSKIELTQSQIKAYESGATMFLFPISIEIPKDYQYQGLSSKEDNIWRANFWNDKLKDIIFIDLPIQKGEKEIFVQENFKVTNHSKDHIIYENEMSEYFTKQNIFEDASKMIKEHSRYSFSECIDIKIIQPKQIAYKGYFDGAELKEQILKALGLKWIGYFNRESYEEIGCQLFIDMYNQQMKEQNTNKTYDDNDYIFLVEFKR